MPRTDTLFPGVSRREFLKYCGHLAVLTGLGEAAVPEIAMALEEAAKRPSVVWSDLQECTGCSVQLLQSRTPDVPTLIFRTISLDYHEVVMAAAGKQAEERYQEIVNGGDFYWIIEGSVPMNPPEAVLIGGRTAEEIVKETYPKAKAVIAIGSCACFGNIQAARPNPTRALGIAEFLETEAGVADPQVINMSRCPGNAEDTVAALAYVLVTGKMPELDAQRRPKFLYGTLIHDHCERRGHFEAGEFVEQFGDIGADQRWCLYKVGCKGPQTYAPCPETRWNGHVSWCVHNGPCIGCAEAGFWDKHEPLYGQAPGVDLPGVGNVSAEAIGVGLGAATVIGLGAHAIGQAATGRFGHGAPVEGEDTTEGGR